MDNGFFELFNYIGNILAPELIEISSIKRIHGFLYIKINNGQNILTNGNEIYDVSDYDHVSFLFFMGDKFCAVMERKDITYVVDLKRMEILFEDEKAYLICNLDDRTLNVYMQNEVVKNAIKKVIYDIETKKYLELPENYEFEKSLGNNLYVFREKNDDYNADFYDDKRCVINVDGKVILKDINGYIHFYDNYIVIEKRKELCIVKINKDSSVEMNTIEQNDEIIAKPYYHDGNIVLIEKGVIKIFDLNLELINKFEISELESVIDSEIVSDILNICIPYTLNGETINKHLFVNLKTGKILSNVRIEGYPYSMPETFIAKSNIKDEEVDYFEFDKTYEQTEYQFYDAQFNKILDVKGNWYYSANDHIFIIGIWDGKQSIRKSFNVKNGTLKDCDYDLIHYSATSTYGCAFNKLTGMLDIVDENLNVIIPNIDYKQLGLSKSKDNFEYFVVNNYVCIIKHIPVGSVSYFKNIIQNTDGQIILESTEYQCYAIGNLIQIDNYGNCYRNSEFLDTLTGEIGQLSINAPVDEQGKIDFKKINDFKDIFRVESSEKRDATHSPKLTKIPQSNKTDD